MARAVRGSDENNAFSRYWRARYCYLAKAGVTKAIKNRANRRERRQGKHQARTERLTP